MPDPVLNLPHEHAWDVRARVARAEIDETDPVRHTAFILLQCLCGAVTAFPLENYAMTTPAYKAQFKRELLTNGLYFDPTAR